MAAVGAWAKGELDPPGWLVCTNPVAGLGGRDRVGLLGAGIDADDGPRLLASFEKGPAFRGRGLALFMGIGFAWCGFVA